METAPKKPKAPASYAQAMEPSELSIMRREDLERLMMEKPEVGLRISHLFSERLRRYETRLEDITLKGVTARLASLLLLLLESEGVVTGDHRTSETTCEECGAEHTRLVREDSKGRMLEGDEEVHPWRSEHPYYKPTRGT
jgi:CRP-like cAMP-binding protein